MTQDGRMPKKSGARLCIPGLGGRAAAFPSPQSYRQNTFTAKAERRERRGIERAVNDDILYKAADCVFSQNFKQNKLPVPNGWKKYQVVRVQKL